MQDSKLNASPMLLVNLVLAVVSFEPQSYCLKESDFQEPVVFYESQVQTTTQSFAMSEMIKSKLLRFEEKPSLQSLFVKKNLAVGDCIKFDRDEVQSLKIGEAATEETPLQAVIVFSANDKSKSYGLLEKRRWDDLSKEATDLTNEALGDRALEEAFQKNQSNLNLIYVICQKDRSDTCDLQFRARASKAEALSNIQMSFKILARSTRGESKDLAPDATRAETPSQRTLKNSDLPQGVYYFWASMFTQDAIFGGASRIDLDAASAPINLSKYPTYSFVFDHLLPKNSFDAYWVNEWPLAFSLGRNLFRIHGNSSDPQRPSNYRTPQSKMEFRLTDGCINTGCEQSKLLETLVALGFLTQEQAFNTEKADPKSLGWKVSPDLGRAFLIVRDR